MKNIVSIFLLVLLTINFSCTTMYKTGQTPDDVYYSPTRTLAIDETKTITNRDNYQEYLSAEDRYLKMRVTNLNRWSCIDDFTYWNDVRYTYNGYNNWNKWNSFGTTYNNCGSGYLGLGVWGNGWNNFNTSFWNNNYCGCGNAFGNPWFANGGLLVVKNTTPSFIRNTSGSNIAAFNNRNNNNINTYTTPKTSSGNNNSFGNLIRRVVTTGGTNPATTSVDRPARTFESNTTPSSSAGGNSGGFKSSGSSSSGGRSGRN